MSDRGLVLASILTTGVVAVIATLVTVWATAGGWSRQHRRWVLERRAEAYVEYMTTFRHDTPTDPAVLARVDAVLAAYATCEMWAVYQRWYRIVEGIDEGDKGTIENEARDLARIELQRRSPFKLEDKPCEDQPEVAGPA